MPARNEALALPHVLANIPSEIDQVLIIDNGSTDGTARIALEHGAKVVSEPIAGYGRACLAGIRSLEENPPDIVAFADADGSDDLSCLRNCCRRWQMNRLILCLRNAFLPNIMP